MSKRKQQQQWEARQKQLALNDLADHYGILTEDQKREWATFIAQKREVITATLAQRSFTYNSYYIPLIDLEDAILAFEDVKERERLLQEYALAVADSLAGAEVPHHIVPDQVDAFLGNVPEEQQVNYQVETTEGGETTIWEWVSAPDVALRFGYSKSLGLYEPYAWDSTQQSMLGAQITINEQYIDSSAEECAVVRHEAGHHWIDVEIWREALLQNQVEAAILEEHGLSVHTPPEEMSPAIRAEVDARIAAKREDPVAIRAGEVSDVPGFILEQWKKNSPHHFDDASYAFPTQHPYARTLYQYQPLERDCNALEEGILDFYDEV